VTLSVIGTNSPPVAEDDSGSGFMIGKAGTLKTANVLLNDSDPNNDTLSITNLDVTGTLGRVSDNGDGTFLYDPSGAFDDLFSGEIAVDTFIYTVADGFGAEDTASVAIKVTGQENGSLIFGAFDWELNQQRSLC